MIERIKKIIDYKGLSVRAFELSIGASDGMIRKAINNKTDIQSKWITKIAEIYPDINTEWLITGKGEMLRSEVENTPVVNYTNIGNPYYNVDFQGGFEVLINDQTVLPEYYINFAPFNKDGTVWCNVSGKSMEPEISNGDKIALKEVKDWRSFLPMGEIYGIVTDEFRTIKRIRKSDIPGHWLLVPSNPAYDAQDIPVDKVLAVFRVLGSVKML